MTARRVRHPLRPARLAVLVTALAAACSPETIQTTVGSGGFRLRTTTLSVGDTVTVDAGVWFHDGTFVDDTSARFSVTPTTVAQIGTIDGILNATSEGTATITATLRGQISLDTTVVVTP